MSGIPFVTSGWQYNEATCPPDRDFIEYLENNKRTQPAVTIFHLGPGMHHKVGMWAATQNNVFVRALSITPAEIDEYVHLAIDNPALNSKYLVDFGDIHLVPLNLLPKLDYITLFHLGEISSQIADPDYHGRSLVDVIEVLTRRLSNYGEILFYENSAGWQDIKSKVEVVMNYKYQFPRSVYKSLTIYKKVRE